MTTVLLLALANRQANAMETDIQLMEFRSRKRLWSTPHLGLLTVAALLPDDWDLTYIDANFEKIPDEEYTYVLMSPSTAQVCDAYAQAVRFRLRGSRILLGGPHVTMCAEEASRYADVVFVGEGEELFHVFLQDERTGRSKRMYRADHRPTLALSPPPRYDLAVKYPYKSIPLQLSRGCPHQCRFCLSSTIYGKSVRRKSLKQVEEELSRIRKLWKRPYLFFTDDNFFINDLYSNAILDILSSRPTDWYAFTDVSVYTKSELLARLTGSGCRKLLIGFESLNESNLQRINGSGFKRKRLSIYGEAVRRIQAEGIGVVGSFVLGLEEDTPETFEELYDFIYDTCMYGTNITISTPFPGTAMYREMVEKGEAPPQDWNQYDGFTLMKPPARLSTEAFYSLYRSLLDRLNSPERIGRVLRAFRKSSIERKDTYE